MQNTTQTNSDTAPTSPARGKSPAKHKTSVASKSDTVLKKLRTAKGATIAQLAEATGWQAHSVRGFLSAIVRKKLSLNLMSDVGKDNVRRYRVADDTGNAP